MRAILLLALLLSGCTIGDEATGEPGVSMSVERSRNNSVEQVEATLTSVRGPIQDWSDLDVTGCTAPAQGAIALPHEFSSCEWDIRVRYAPTGRLLYSTG